MSIIEKASYINTSRLLNYYHPDLEKLVADKGWRELPEFERIGAIYDFVRDSILFGFNSSDELTASQVLSDGYGQCNTKSTLLMSLLRACGIACRFHAFKIDKEAQKGIITGAAYQMSPNNIIHSWVEVLYKENWKILEGVIIDSAYLKSLQHYFFQKKELCGYGVSTTDLMNPVVKWKGDNTFIQNMSISHDYGTYNSPDDYYSKYGSNLTGFKKLIYSHLVRHKMNRKVQRIREKLWHYKSKNQ